MKYTYVEGEKAQEKVSNLFYSLTNVKYVLSDVTGKQGVGEEELRLV